MTSLNEVPLYRMEITFINGWKSAIAYFFKHCETPTRFSTGNGNRHLSLAGPVAEHPANVHVSHAHNARDMVYVYGFDLNSNL
jgi:hypothetical protein